MTPASAGDFALEVFNLRHDYGKRRALDDVSLRARARGMLALAGPNGAGKTTLFNLLTGLFYPRAGRVRILGRDIAQNPRAVLADIGVVFQQRAADMDLTVGQNLRYHAALHGMRGDEARARIDEESARMGIADKLGRRAGALSGGELRRMEIARALLHRPALLLLDEPTTGLDAPARIGVLRHLRELSRDRAVVFATHLFDEIREDDDLVVLDRGRVTADGTMKSVLAGRGVRGLDELFSAAE